MVTFNQHIFAKILTIIPPANKRHGFCKIFVRQINFPSAFNCRCCVPSPRKVIICGLPTVRFFLLRQKIYISMHFRHFREFQLIPNLSSCGLRHQQSSSHRVPPLCELQHITVEAGGGCTRMLLLLIMVNQLFSAAPGEPLEGTLVLQGVAQQEK